jgi:hypothetical protein
VKRILITQSQLRNYSGSEVVTLELLEHFTELGWGVTILTHYLNHPMQSSIESCKPEVILTNSKEAEKLDPNNFDVVWIHHYTLTSSFLGELVNSTKPIIVFHHMSSVEPIELPIFFDQERQIADHILYNSSETMDLIHEQMNKKNADSIESIFDNPSPDTFFENNQSYGNKKELKSIAIVSNHPPEEIFKAKEIIEATSDVSVDVYGRVGGKVERVEPKILKAYDAIISIGKTVQYSIASNTLVYCYDRFGGPGYINETNYDLAHYHNFSGRGFETKSAEDIAEEIVASFKTASIEFDIVHKKHASKFLLSNKINKILNTERIENRNIEGLDIFSFSKYLDIMQRTFPMYCTQIHSSRIEIQKLRHTINQIDKKITEYKKTIDREKSENNAIRQSREFKLGTLVLSGPRYIQKKLKNK